MQYNDVNSGRYHISFSYNPMNHPEYAIEYAIVRYIGAITSSTKRHTHLDYL